MFPRVISKVSKNTGFGDPVIVNGRKIIPVYKSIFGFGFGFGNKLKKNNSGGMGGTIASEPIGVFDVSGNKTKFVPAIDVKGILRCFTVLFFITAVILDKNEKKYYKNMYKGKYKYKDMKRKSKGSK